jgi:vitamin B12 transporter
MLLSRMTVVRGRAIEGVESAMAMSGVESAMRERWMGTHARGSLVVAVALAAGAIAAVGAAAQVPAKSATLEPVVVTAARGPQPIVDVLAEVTVIGAEEIARSGADSLVQLLQRQPGMEIAQNGGPGSVSAAFIRGANSGQTLVLIDGLRVASASAGTTTLEAIPLAQIERIEILRGPASALYGADAIGGVIQVFTRRGEKGLTGNVDGGYGTYATANGAAGISGTAGPVTFSLEAGGRRSDGFNAIVNPVNFSFNDDRDGYRGDSVGANVALTLAKDQVVSAQYLRSYLNAQYDGGPGFDERQITTLQTWQVASRNRLTPYWVSRLSAGAGSDDSVSQTAFGDFSFTTTQRQYTWQNELALREFTPVPGTMTLGYERLEQRLADNADFPVTGRNTNSFYGIYQLTAGASTLQANLRRDQSSQYGGQTTGTLAFGYRFSDEWRVTASYGTGFKAPTFNDLYYPGFSNAALEPETSRNVEGGVYWRRAIAAGDLAGSLEARAIAYRNQVRQLIVFQCDVAFNCAPDNVSRATLTGVTLGVDARTDTGTRVAASLDLQSPEDDLTGKLLPRRARQHGALTLGQDWRSWQFGAEVVASSYRYDDALNLRRLGGYGILNLTASWRFVGGWTAFARADNVFNKDYQLAADYATGGATVFAGLRWQP